jgi:hypothetical protein
MAGLQAKFEHRAPKYKIGVHGRLNLRNLKFIYKIH